MSEEETLIEKKIPILLLIGEIGSGKTSLSRSICDFSQDFSQVSAKENVTKEIIITQTKFKGTNDSIICCDTPGVLEGDEIDNINMNKNIKLLVELKYLNSILIVMNGQNVRINRCIEEKLLQFHQMFKENFLNHVAFVFTRWSYRNSEIQDREDEDITESSKEMQMNEKLIELGIRKKTDKPVKCFFVNNMVGMSIDQYENYKKFESLEIHKHYEFLSKIKEHVQSLNDFSTADLKNFVQEEEILNNQLEQKRQSVQEQNQFLLQLIQQYQSEQLKIDLADFQNEFQQCSECKKLIQIQEDLQTYCNDCNEFYENLKKSNFDYEQFIRNFRILRPQNNAFPSKDSKINKIHQIFSDYKQFFAMVSNINNINIINYKKFMTWLADSAYILIDYEDGNHKGKLILEFRPSGYYMGFGQELLQNRAAIREDNSECQDQTLGELLNLCARYAERNQNYQQNSNDCHTFSNKIWQKFADKQ